MRKTRRRSERSDRDNPAEVNFLGLSGKTWLILGGVAVAGLVIWKIMQARKAATPAGVAGLGCPCPPPAPAPAPDPAAAGPAAPAAEPEAAVADEFGGGDLL